jgi:hypothetical protein
MSKIGKKEKMLIFFSKYFYCFPNLRQLGLSGLSGLSETQTQTQALCASTISKMTLRINDS